METYEQIKNEEYRLKTKTLLNELPDYCTAYINSLNNKQPRTRLAYLQDIKIFFDFLKQNNPNIASVSVKSIDLSLLDSLTREDMVEYDNWLESYYLIDENGKERHYTNSPTSRSRKLSSLRAFYNFLCNTAEYIEHNPAAKLSMPKVKEKEIRTVESDELPKIFEVLERDLKLAEETLKTMPEEKRNQRIKLAPAVVKRDIAIISLFLGTGLRISELVGINTLDVKWDTGRINIVRKGGKHDHVYMPDEVLDIVGDYHFNYRDMFSDFSEEDALFLSSKHCRITTKQVEVRIKHYVEEALGKNSGITPHKFRATFGTNYYRSTGDIYATATVMGHSSVETTQKRYAKVSESARENMKSINIRKIEK